MQHYKSISLLIIKSLIITIMLSTSLMNSDAAIVFKYFFLSVVLHSSAARTAQAAFIEGLYWVDSIMSVIENNYVTH